MTPFKVVISNGFSRYNLADAAAALHRRGVPVHFITGAYPAGKIWALLRRLPGGRRWAAKTARLAARRVDAPSSATTALWGAEAVQMFGAALRRLGGVFRDAGDWLDVAGFRLYGRRAAGVLDRSAAAGAGEAAIYHYRSGFGGPSVDRARARGMIVLCEHTIAHPRLVAWLVDHAGRLPPAGVRPTPDRFWRNALDDVERAEHVVVNSDFVRGTFIHQGVRPDCVHVVYVGVDRGFFDMLPARVPAPAGAPLRLLFAGGLETRKGAEILLDALSGLDDAAWTLDVAGGVDPDAARRFAGVLADPRVRLHGLLPRSQVAVRMTQADVFVFPSLAEGSARVVFEALAAGCFVVTTPNSGSIVEHERHGLLVPPGDVDALRAALRRAAGMGGDRLRAVGDANAALIRAEYDQDRYGERLVALYEKLIASSAGPSGGVSEGGAEDVTA